MSARGSGRAGSAACSPQNPPVIVWNRFQVPRRHAEHGRSRGEPAAPDAPVATLPAFG